jgi:hypothetical protein
MFFKHIHRSELKETLRKLEQSGYPTPTIVPSAVHCNPMSESISYYLVTAFWGKRSKEPQFKTKAEKRKEER